MSDRHRDQLQDTSQIYAAQANDTQPHPLAEALEDAVSHLRVSYAAVGDTAPFRRQVDHEILCMFALLTPHIETAQQRAEAWRTRLGILGPARPEDAWRLLETLGDRVQLRERKWLDQAELLQRPGGGWVLYTPRWDRHSEEHAQGLVEMLAYVLGTDDPRFGTARPECGLPQEDPVGFAKLVVHEMLVNRAAYLVALAFQEVWLRGLDSCFGFVTRTAWRLLTGSERFPTLCQCRRLARKYEGWIRIEQDDITQPRFTWTRCEDFHFTYPRNTWQPRGFRPGRRPRKRRM